MKQEIFPERLRKNSIQFPEETVSYYDDKKDCYETLNYTELYQKVLNTSSYLQKTYQSGDRLVLMLNTSLEFVIMFCACLDAKIIPIPLPTPRKNRKAQLLTAVINDATPAVVVSEKSTIDYLGKKLAEDGEEIKTTLVSVDVFLEDHQSTAVSKPAISPDDIAFLQYTSGSTGKPKGVMVTHANLASNLNEICRKFGHSNATKALLWLPNYHDMGLIGGVLQPIYIGFTLTLMSPLAFLMKPLKWLKMVSELKITTSGGPNFAYDLCIDRIKDEDLASLDLSSWDVAFVGAEPIQHYTLQAFYEKFKVCGFKMEGFYPCYGLAESTLIVCGGDKKNKPIVKLIEPNDFDEIKFGSFLNKTEKLTGKRIVSSGDVENAFQDIVIVSPETLEACEDGVAGEIWVSGSSVTKGYWNNIDETNKSFDFKIKNGDQSKSYLRTGDIGFIDQGEIYVTGRLKEIIIIDGKNYIPQDIEKVVKECHSAIWLNKQASFSVETENGEGLVVMTEINRNWLRKDLSPILKAIRRELVENFELPTKDIVLLAPGSIPVTSSGKIQRTKCKINYLQNELQSIEKTYG